MLHPPDPLGYPDAIAMARDHQEIVQQGLRLKKTGNRIVALMGGREIHPVSDRKSTRLNSSHLGISYAVFCLKKKPIRVSRTDVLTPFSLLTISVCVGAVC